MEIKRRLVQELAQVREFARQVQENLLSKRGVFSEYLNVWVPDKVSLTLKQVQMLLEEFQQETKDLERIKLMSGYNSCVPQMANELMQRHGGEGVERFSKDLLQVMGLEDKYDEFPFNDFDRVFKEYSEELPLPIQNLFTGLSNVSDEQLSEMVEMSFERGEEGFTFSETALVVLNGLLVVKRILVEALGRFEFYVTKKEEFREFLRDVCLDYYNNTILGNPVRKYSKREEELPEEGLTYDEEDTIKKSAGFWGLGIGAATGALALATFMADDVGNLVTFTFLIGGVGWLIGRLTGRSIARRKDNARDIRYSQIQEANAAEDKRWREEVIKEFNENAGDLEYFNEVVDSLIEKLNGVDALLTAYIQEAFDFMPEKYRFDNLAVATFYDYIKDRRVETMQQTVNLYVSEQRLEEFRQKQLMNQQAILRAQDRLLEENQRKNALLEAQVAQQKQLERKLTDLKSETQKLSEIEQKKTEELSKLRDNVEDIKIEMNKLT